MHKKIDATVINAKEETTVLRRGKFRILKPNFTKLTSGLIKHPHISAEKILFEYETTGGKH